MPDVCEANGSCLCGKIKISADSMNTHAATCHCSMCRKWSGGPLMVVDCGTDVSFSNQEHIKIYNSSDWAERGFCGECGSHLFYRLKENNQHFMPVGLIDSYNQFIFDHQIFIDDKPDYYSFANETTNMTGEEVFAQFSNPT